MSMDGLAAFLAARLDEDAAAAKAATPGPWCAPVYITNAEGVTTDIGYPPGDAFVTLRPVMSEDESRSRADVAHIARHDPARALREVEAKRAIVREHEIRDGPCRVCTAIHEGRATRFRAPCWTLLSVAAVYNDHPDYRPEWKP